MINGGPNMHIKLVCVWYVGTTIMNYITEGCISIMCMIWTTILTQKKNKRNPKSIFTKRNYKWELCNDTMNWITEGCNYTYVYDMYHNYDSESNKRIKEAFLQKEKMSEHFVMIQWIK